MNYQKKTTSQSGNPSFLAAYIDHTLLKPEATAEQIESLCREAIEAQFTCVCINPSYVELASKLLAGTGVSVCTVISFPLGASTTNAKIAETKEAISNGAKEIDMVINIGALKSGDLEKVKLDTAAVVSAASGKTKVKVIIEACLLNNEEKVLACQIAKQAGADFVKTSTGFSTSGASIEDVKLMRETVGPEMGVKAAGRIRDAEMAKAMIDAGATRLGTSNSLAIISSQKGLVDY